MIFSILLDGGPSRNGPLLELSESLRDDILGTHPHTRLCGSSRRAWC
jgi:hypothetical protein